MKCLRQGRQRFAQRAAILFLWRTWRDLDLLCTRPHGSRHGLLYVAAPQLNQTIQRSRLPCPQKLDSTGLPPSESTLTGQFMEQTVPQKFILPENRGLKQIESRITHIIAWDAKDCI